jgi:hypothetical protein
MARATALIRPVDPHENLFSDAHFTALLRSSCTPCHRPVPAVPRLRRRLWHLIASHRYQSQVSPPRPSNLVLPRATSPCLRLSAILLTAPSPHQLNHTPSITPYDTSQPIPRHLRPPRPPTVISRKLPERTQHGIVQAIHLVPLGEHQRIVQRRCRELQGELAIAHALHEAPPS